MKQSELSKRNLHKEVFFVQRFESSTTDRVVEKGTVATLVGIIPPTGIAGYHASKTPVLLIDHLDENPFTVHEDFVELV